MRYATATAFRSALEQRLLTTARRTGLPVVRLRKQIVFDRVLARMVIAAPDRWMLKGALALDFRFGPGSRTTKDMDLARQDDERAATSDFLAAQAVDLDDYFTFAIQKQIRLEPLEGGAVRYHVAADLAGRLFEEVIVDVGFGDPPLQSPEMLQGPNLLTFADIDPIAVPALPLEQHVAEKVHAYTRRYPSGRHSTRVKDLVDLIVIRSHAQVEAGRLRTALRVTFSRRGTHPLPTSLPAPPVDWRPAYRRMARDVGINPDVVVGHGLAVTFLAPILDGSVSDEAWWNPDTASW